MGSAEKSHTKEYLWAGGIVLALGSLAILAA